MGVLGVGLVFLVIAALAYAVTRSGVRVTFHVPLSVPDEVLVRLAALLLSASTVVCGAVAVALEATGVSVGVEWALAIGLTLLVGVPLARRTWAAAPVQEQLIQARRDARAGIAPRRPGPQSSRNEK